MGSQRTADQTACRRRIDAVQRVVGPIEIRGEPWLGHPGPIVTVTSSHLGHDKTLQRSVCEYLSRSLLDCRARDAALFIATGTAIAPWAERAAKLFGVPTIRGVVNREAAGGTAGVLFHATNGQALSRDEVAIAVADRVDALFVRQRGKVERCLAARLRQRRDASTRVAITRHPRCGAGPLVAAGAIGWYLPSPEAGGRSPSPVHETIAGTTANGATLVDTDNDVTGDAGWADREGQWLVHCTRALPAAPPGQTERQYLDAMLLGHADPRDTSPLGTLRRIVRSGRLVASVGSTTHRHPVVCFSACALTELLARRCYRPHLHRWDYEPYGVAIRIDTGRRIGVRPVVYGTPDDLRQIDAADSYRFQPRGTTYDWTQEREWRCPVDIDLTRLDPDSVRLFVPTAEDARQLATRGRWRVSVVSPPSPP